MNEAFGHLSWDLRVIFLNVSRRGRKGIYCEFPKSKEGVMMFAILVKSVDTPLTKRRDRASARD